MTSSCTQSAARISSSSSIKPEAPEQVEAWVLSIVDRVRERQPIEDDRVELKADWPDAEKAARRVAGHANASGGGSVLWIIGLDEQRGVVPFARTDPAMWVQQLHAHFDRPDTTTAS